MKSMLRTVTANDITYEALLFVCPGCVAGSKIGNEGVHMLPVNARGDIGKPSWDWDGNLEAPTLSPSILTTGPFRCHSYLKAGVFEFLDDSNHPLTGQKVPIPDLPDWVENVS